MPVGECRQRFILALRFRIPTGNELRSSSAQPVGKEDHTDLVGWASVVFGEADRRANLIAEAHAFFFIGVDLVAPPRRHVLQAEQVGQGLPQCCAAALAQVDALAVADGVQVAALLALLCPARGHVFILTHRQDHAVDQVTRPLVIDDGARTKLGDRQETRP